MNFPKAPGKPIKGNLRLIIRDPNVEAKVTDDPREEFKDDVDYVDVSKIKLPKGFSLHKEEEK